MVQPDVMASMRAVLALDVCRAVLAVLMVAAVDEAETSIVVQALVVVQVALVLCVSFGPETLVASHQLAQEHHNA